MPGVLLCVLLCRGDARGTLAESSLEPAHASAALKTHTRGVRRPRCLLHTHAVASFDVAVLLVLDWFGRHCTRFSRCYGE